ncbi:PFE-CTERM domain-containing protein [Waterburya agarophytonicola]
MTFREVPFEFSPSLGLLIMGGCGIASYISQRRSDSKHKENKAVF